MASSTVVPWTYDDNGVVTETSEAQIECMESCILFFSCLEEDFASKHPTEVQEFQDIGLMHPTNGKICLIRQAHIDYCKRALSYLPGSYSSLDASRAWVAYWVIHSLELLNAEPYELYPDAIKTLASFQNPITGGFGGNVTQMGHSAPTYAACLTLAIIGTPDAFDTVNRESLYNFFMSLKDSSSGAFAAHTGGEVDIRVTYCVIAIASLFNILTPELTANVVEYAVECQTYEGGFGGEPGNEAHGGYAFCAVATLWILQKLDAIRDIEALCHWISFRQMAYEGGYQGRTNKLVDGCYSFWQCAIPAMLKDHHVSQHFLCDTSALQSYILLCAQVLQGGLRDKPQRSRDYYHTCYCLSGLSIAQHGNDLATVFGDTDTNVLVQTHPAYNIAVEKVDRIQAYFADKSFLNK